MATHTLPVPGAEITYDVHGPLPTADGRAPLLLVAQPMDAAGFGALVAQLGDRTVVTYDPRGIGRSTRSDGRVDNDPHQQATDLHALVAALGAGPVEVFASSGGAVTMLAMVAEYPHDVTTLVAHEPPILAALPDADAARRAQLAMQEVYADRGGNAGMAEFIRMTSWAGPFTDEYFAQPAADPAAFGMPTDDDGRRDDPLLTDRSDAITAYRPDPAALAASGTRVVLAVGEETGDTLTARTARGVAELLGQEAVVFPSHHGGFAGGEYGWPGKPAEFAARLREVLGT